ncbi:hypothetical protein [Nocardia sp. Marseille-Q1738]
MGKIVTVPDENVHHLIRQAYNAGGPYQWAREALVNSIQAEATWIYFGVDEESFTTHGVARRYVADNGVGMNEENLQLFLSSFGGGGRTISLTENFGQGFKASCYEWNPYGIIVLSWTDETPEGRMIWIHFDERHDRWKLKDFYIYEPGSDPEDHRTILTTASLLPSTQLSESTCGSFISMRSKMRVMERSLYSLAMVHRETR